MKKLLNIAAVSAVLSLLTASFAEAATYIANRTIGSGSANISITTDGTIGALSSGNILDWTVVLTQGGETFTLKGPASGANSSFLLTGAALQANAKALLFDFSKSGLLLIQAPTVGSGQTFWCLQVSGCFEPASTGAEGLLAGRNYSNLTHQAYSGVQTIATLSSAVPEPATWAMMIVGFGAVGSVVRTSRRRSVFSAA
jgi:hypothetical protein